MDETINADMFAKLVVSANSFEGSAEDIATKSLELYKAAYDKAIEHNAPIIEERDKQDAEALEALNKIKF